MKEPLTTPKLMAELAVMIAQGVLVREGERVDNAGRRIISYRATRAYGPPEGRK